MSNVSNRATAMPAALVAVSVGLGISAVIRVWFARYGIHAGLWGISDCSQGGCHGVRWDDVHGIDFDIVLSGYAATVSALFTAVLGGLTGIARIGGQRGPIKPALTTSTIALAAIAYFVIRMLIDGKLDIAWGVVPGLGCALATAILLRRRA